MRLLSTQNMTITPEMAKDYLAYNIFEYQRPIKSEFIDELSTKMKNDIYIGANIVLGTMNGDLFIADGQHTLTAIVDSGIPQQTTIRTVLCDSEREKTTLYQQYDGGRSRSTRDHARAEAGFLKIKWPAKTIATVIGGAAVIKWGIYLPKNISKDDRVKMLRDFLKEGAFVNEITRSTIGGKMLLKTHVVAVMMQTYKIDEDIALLFWKSVRDGELLTKTSPAYHLREFLIHTDTRGGTGRKTAHKRDFYAKCCKAWNAYVSGVEMKRLTFGPEEKTPVLMQTLPGMCINKAA